MGSQMQMYGVGTDAEYHLLQILGNAVTLCLRASIQRHRHEEGLEGAGGVAGRGSSGEGISVPPD